MSLEFRSQRGLVGADLMLFGRLSGVSALVIEPLVTMLEPESYVVYQLFNDEVFGVVAARRSVLAQVPLEVLLEAAREQLAPAIGMEGYWAGSVTVRPVSEKRGTEPPGTEPQGLASSPS